MQDFRRGEQEAAGKLAAYARSLDTGRALPDWSRASADSEHLGAKLADAVLQRAVNYERFVRPRVKRLVLRYPDAHNLTGLQRAVAEVGASKMLDVASGEKPLTFESLVQALALERVESVADLREFLSDRWRANRLLNVPGVGPKTIAFLKLLVGLDAVALDKHLLAALKSAGIPACDPSEAESLFRLAAQELGITMSQLDALLWRHGSGTTS